MTRTLFLDTKCALNICVGTQCSPLCFRGVNTLLWHLATCIQFHLNCVNVEVSSFGNQSRPVDVCGKGVGGSAVDSGHFTFTVSTSVCTYVCTVYVCMCQ